MSTMLRHILRCSSEKFLLTKKHIKNIISTAKTQLDLLYFFHNIQYCSSVVVHRYVCATHVKKLHLFIMHIAGAGVK